MCDTCVVSSFWNQKCSSPSYASVLHLTVMSSCVHMILSTWEVSSVTSKLKYHMQQISQQLGGWIPAHPSVGYENRLLPPVQAMRINQNCASPCKASGHLQKPYLKHRCPGQSTTASPSPNLTELSNQAPFILLHKRLFSQLSFSICFSLSFLFQRAGRKFTANIEDTAFPEAARFFFWMLIKYNCIPAKWWDCDVLKRCKIHELWLQTSMCNSWFNDSLCLHCTFKV